MPSVLNDPKLDAMLAGLHGASTSQDEAINHYFFHERTGPWQGMEPRDHAFLADKMVALEKDKAEFCYMMCRAIGARRIVEVGTSFGVSTLYLAAAVRDNGGGVVLAAENEPLKCERARANFEAAGLSSFIEFHQADVIAACDHFAGPIDFVLFDIWTHVVRPVLDTLASRLRPGAVICTDNTAGERSRENYAEFFALLDDPANGFRTMTLPFEGGFELSVKL
ncbi:MAG TPA: class I SAM-dependent methyltransferase [Caulobacteraceae bacterium]|jgi:predicted O-methyltransferase YrrM|nr:class I SAM-dependent methyltransferase [Caulobacteraceae bacterium]